MLLSDGDLRKEIDAGRLVLDPWDEAMLQPSSVDVRLDRFFRVFQNSRYTHIDPAQQQDELTQLIEAAGEEPFVLHPGEFVLGSTFESVGLPDDLAGRLEGKALAVDTPVPTPTGWRTMGELRPGDAVFGLDGTRTPVLAATEVMLGRPCYEVSFSDGQSIVADADHRWLTITRDAPAAVVTTARLAQTLQADDGWNHHVPLALPVDSPPPAHAHGGVLTHTAGGVRRRTKVCVDQRLSVAPTMWRCDGSTHLLRFAPRYLRGRAVVEARRVPSVPVRCIEVDAPDGMFLVGPTFIPTHNSSLGRLGLLTHSTAGFIDPGFTGHITLELSNVANLPITLWPGMKIGQLCLFRLSSPAERPYGSAGVGSRYQGQRGPTPSRAHLNFHRIDTRRS